MILAPPVNEVIAMIGSGTIKYPLNRIKVEYSGYDCLRVVGFVSFCNFSFFLNMFKCIR